MYDQHVNLLRAALPSLSAAGAHFFLGFLRSEAPGWTGRPVQEFASRIGIGDRFRLARELRRAGLPPWRDLVTWVRVRSWIVEWLASGTSLARQAMEAGTEPRSLYRSVERATGWSWSDVRHTAERHGLLPLAYRVLPGWLAPAAAVGAGAEAS